jgi:hypothetical protein
VVMNSAPSLNFIGGGPALRHSQHSSARLDSGLCAKMPIVVQPQQQRHAEGTATAACTLNREHRPCRKCHDNAIRGTMQVCQWWECRWP